MSNKSSSFNLDPSHKERVTSTYAEIYLTDDYCDYKNPDETFESLPGRKIEVDWVSPSDLLIDKVELQAPFTSKITRGITHAGILNIGNELLEIERDKFLKYLTQLIDDNEKGWIYILDYEKEIIEAKVKKMYNEIFKMKSKIMTKEISFFYEQTLQELQFHVRSEVKKMLTSAYANIVSDANAEIKQKLAREKKALTDFLNKKYANEVAKIKNYYKLLYENELQRHKSLINKAICERNDALLAFYRQIEIENLTSTMYVICTERKKCKIKKIILENYQTAELFEKMKSKKDKLDLLEMYKNNNVHLTTINREWEEKIRKLLQLFLKFISFSLKLLPQQALFLLDFEKMVVLQLNEIQKHPDTVNSFIVDNEELKNTFQFEESAPKISVCKEKPFVIVGNLNPPTPPRYGSRETLPSDVDLPYLRVQRQYVYAKCHKFEDIQAMLESQRCVCQDIPPKSLSDATCSSQLNSSNKNLHVSHPSEAALDVSSDELLLLEDIQRLHECPGRSCQDWARRFSFPNINYYIDYSEANFERVKTILGKPKPNVLSPELIDIKSFLSAKLPFSATNEQYRTTETQYSSQECLNMPELECVCCDISHNVQNKSQSLSNEHPSKEFLYTLEKRKTSLRRIINDNPNLLKMFTEESFDFIL